MTQETPRQPIDERAYTLLQQETASWVQQGLVTPEQAQAILSKYTPRPALTVSRWLQGKLITTLAILGAVLVGTGVLLWVGANWQETGRSEKLALLFSSLIGMYGAGFWLRVSRGYVRLGTAIIFLGSVLYGAAIFLIAQIYHVRAGEPSLLLFWFLGVLPLAYAVRSRMVLLLALALAEATGISYVFHWLENGREAVAFFALALVSSILVIGLGLIHRAVSYLRYLAMPIVWAGFLTLFVPLFVFTFGGVFQETLRVPSPQPWQYQAMFHLSAAVALIGLAMGWLRRSRDTEQPRGTPARLGALAVLTGAAYIVLLLPFESPNTYAILFNALLAAVILGTIFTGYLEREPNVVNLGLLLFTLDVTVRYFDVGFKLLDRSVFFIVGGLLLLAAGFVMERLRRKMMRGMAEEPADA